MGTVDPSYPLYPIACTVASTMLLLVLMNSFVRQSWNLGIAFLCFWLFLENVTNAVNAIIWSDNADIKMYVYCDIVSRVQMIAYAVKPLATLIITRRLYLIATLQSADFLSEVERRRDIVTEWTLGFIIPMLVAGPLYYINQGVRFRVLEGFGCTNESTISILEILIEESWTILPPMISSIFYYPKIARTYYRQKSDVNSFLRSDPSVSPTNYTRILVLASIDILFTLPIGIVNIVLSVITALSPPRDFHFYPGWTYLHTNWEPVSISYAEQQASGTSSLAQTYFYQWSSPALAFCIFGLFGLSSEARTSYWHIICTVGGTFGWRPTTPRLTGHNSLGEIEFYSRQQDSSIGINSEMG